MKNKLRVGIAGYGVVGKRRRSCIDEHPALKTVAVSDIRFDGDGTLDDGVVFYDTYEKVLDHDLDVLFVCLSNDVAAATTVGALEHGMHVFCEKPPGRDMADIAHVRTTLAAHPKQIVKYGFNHRYHDSVQHALRLIKSGELGEIINLRAVYGKSKLISWGQTTWRTERRLAGGGILLDQGIHMVDLLRLFVGEFDQVQSFVDNRFWGKDVEDNAYALMRTADGKVAMLHSSATSWRHRFHLDITLSRGALTLAGILSGSKSYGDETLIIARASHDESGDPKEQTICYADDASWALEIDEFARALVNGQPIINGTVEDAYNTMELVYRIYCADPDWKARWGLVWRPEDLY